MADPKGPLPGVSPRLAELLRIAGDLRGLPRAEFRAELKAALVSGAEGERSAATVSVGGRPLATLDDILARLEEMAHEPKMVAHDVRAALRDLPEKTMRFLASLNRCTLGVSRFSGDSHWERHPAGDEMLHILEGEAEVVTLTEAGPVRSTVSAGSVFVCRRGLWHRVLPRSLRDARGRNGALERTRPTAGGGTSAGASTPRRRGPDPVRARPPCRARGSARARDHVEHDGRGGRRGGAHDHGARSVHAGRDALLGADALGASPRRR